MNSKITFPGSAYQAPINAIHCFTPRPPPNRFSFHRSCCLKSIMMIFKVIFLVFLARVFLGYLKLEGQMEKHYEREMYIDLIRKNYHYDLFMKMAESMSKVDSMMSRVENNQAFEEKHRTLNFADLKTGASVIKKRNENFDWTTPTYKFSLTSSYEDEYQDVDHIIDFSAYDCYQANGSQGALTLQMKNEHKIFAFAYEQRLKGDGDYDSLKRFEVYGLIQNQREKKEKSVVKAYFLGSYDFTAGRNLNTIVENDPSKQSYWKVNDGNRYKQYFICSHENCQRNYGTIRVEYQNSGEIGWTSLCRFEVLVKTNFNGD